MAMETGPNPYASPTNDEPATQPPESTVAVDFVPIMRRWEKLRLYYNAVLILFVLFLSFVAFPRYVTDISYWAAICFGGLTANVCFLTAPAIEAYGTWLRLWNGALTTMLFLIGLGFTALLASLCIANFRYL